MSDIIAGLRKNLLGWKAYFGIAQVLSSLRDVDKWIRRKLRCYHWKQRGQSGYRELRRRGVREQIGAWTVALVAHPALTQALPARYFAELGLPSLVER